MGLQHRPDMHENVIQVIFPQTALTIWFISRRFTLLLHCSNKANLSDQLESYQKMSIMDYLWRLN